MPASCRGAARLRAAIYLRVSTEEQARRGYSLGEQLERCVARARELGADEIVPYRDEGVSGELLERPALTALRLAARAGNLDCFVCLDPDRLARKLSHQLLVTEELERAGVRLSFLAFDWADTPEGRLFAQLRGAIAEFEKEKIRARTLLGRHAKARSGGLPHYTRPYGYCWSKGALAVDTDEADAVRAAFAWFTAEPDLGYRALARRMQLHHPPRRGSWDGSALARLLRSPTYLGQLHVERYDARGAHLNRHRPRDERTPYRREKPLAQAVAVAVPALVDPELWRAAQDKARRLGRHRGGEPGAFLLSGLVRCGRCGATMPGKTQRAGGRVYRYHRCARGCGARQVRADDLEADVWGLLSPSLGDPAALAAALRPAPPDAGEVAAAAQLAALTREEERIWRAYRRGLVDEERLEAALRETSLRRATLAAPDAEPPPALPQGDAARLVEEALRDVPRPVRRAVVRELVEEVVVFADEVHVLAHLP